MRSDLLAEKFNNCKIKIAIQKDGELTNISLKILKKIFSKKIIPPQGRELISFDKNQEIGIVWAKNKSICKLIKNEAVDIAILGSDQLLEETSSFENIVTLNDFKSLAKWPLVLATNNFHLKSPKEIKIIATQFPTTTKKILKRMKISAQVIQSNGSTEAYVYLKMRGKKVDAIADISITGNTLRRNHLKKWGSPLHYFYPILIANKKGEKKLKSYLKAKPSKINLRPMKKLLMRHTKHTSTYSQNFLGLKLALYPDVFNPEYTKVSRLLGKKLLKLKGRYNSVLDMFCGSGALGLLIAKNSKKLVGADISKVAIKCSQKNALQLGFKNTEYRQSDLWKAVKQNEKFNLIIANPPLLPTKPKNILEMAVADSPDMKTTIKFIQGCSKHLSKNGKVLMTFSNASRVFFGDPLKGIRLVAEKSDLKMKVVATKDVGYEIYRVLEFRKKQ